MIRGGVNAVLNLMAATMTKISSVNYKMGGNYEDAYFHVVQVQDKWWNTTRTAYEILAAPTQQGRGGDR
jgi:hypothetical protein